MVESGSQVINFYKVKNRPLYLVVNSLVQILHEDVSHARAAKGGVALGPHDAASLVLDGCEVHRVQCALRCISGYRSQSRTIDGPKVKRKENIHEFSSCDVWCCRCLSKCLTVSRHPAMFTPSTCGLDGICEYVAER